MRSLLFVAPRRVELLELSLGPVPPGQVLVQAEHSAISAGTELLVYRGQAPSGMSADARLPALSGCLQFPLKYGYSLVGRVAELGAGVEAGWKGRRVFAFHPHESHFHSVPDQLTPLPDEVAPLQGVFLSNLETAVNLVQDGAPLLGERVLVLGQGVVGLLLTATLSRFPLAELVTVDPLPSRRKASLALGATASLAPGEAPRAHFDLSYEVSGHPATLNEALEATCFSGRVVIGSWYGEKKAEIELGGSFHRSRIRLMSSQVSTLDPRLCGAWTRERRLQQAVHLLRCVEHESLVSHRFPLERAPEAFELLDRGHESTLQVVLDYGS